MTTITQQLADALRTLADAPPPCDCGIQGCARTPCPQDVRNAAMEQANEALAAYDAQQAAPVAAGDHTPGPWRDWFDTDTRGNPGFRVSAPEVSLIAWLPYGDEELARANARRIVACVNACEGIPTTDLERPRFQKVLRDIHQAVREDL